MQGLTPGLHAYWKNINEKYPHTFLSAFLMANLVPSLDISTLPAEVQTNDSLLLIARFNFQKEHYWDNFDYTDERMLYTPLFQPKLDSVHIETCKGRSLRPLIVVKDGKPLLTDVHIDQLNKKEIQWSDLVKQGVVEYLDATEEESALVAFFPHQITPQHTVFPRGGHVKLPVQDLTGVNLPAAPKRIRHE